MFYNKPKTKKNPSSYAFGFLDATDMGNCLRVHHLLACKKKLLLLLLVFAIQFKATDLKKIAAAAISSSSIPPDMLEMSNATRIKP